jgi:hypothetical protein
MQEAVSTVERVDKRKTNPNLFKPGEGGRPKGIPNKVTRTIRQAVMESIEPGNCHPDGLAGWLIERARGGIEDRKIYAAVVSRVIPIEITGEGGGPVKIDLGWLTGRKVGGEVIDITPTQSHIGHTDGGEQAEAGGVPDLLSDTQEAQAPAPLVAKRSRSKARKGESE